MKSKIVSLLFVGLETILVFFGTLVIVDLHFRVKDLEKQVDIQYRMWQDTQNRMWEHIGNDERHNK